MLSQTGRRDPQLPMVPQVAKEIFILGLTRQGKAFRPSDWAERLAGVMSQFRPGGPQPGPMQPNPQWGLS